MFKTRLLSGGMAAMALDDPFSRVVASAGGLAVAIRADEVLIASGRRSGASYDQPRLKEKYSDPVEEGPGQCLNSHAAFDLVIDAAREGVSLFGCTIVVYELGCVNCAKVLIGCGVNEFRTVVPITKAIVLQLLSEAGVEHTTYDSKRENA
jgi:deoxycytidylate deaminase